MSFRFRQARVAALTIRADGVEIIDCDGRVVRGGAARTGMVLGPQGVYWEAVGPVLAPGTPICGEHLVLWNVETSTPHVLR